jgi:hypothetical protein
MPRYLVDIMPVIGDRSVTTVDELELELELRCRSLKNVSDETQLSWRSPISRIRKASSSWRRRAGAGLELGPPGFVSDETVGGRRRPS